MYWKQTGTDLGVPTGLCYCSDTEPAYNFQIATAGTTVNCPNP